MEPGQAAAGYEGIRALGLESAALLCNTADAYLKAGETARAILWYRRALKCDPSYADASYNLSLASERVQDDIEAVPEFFLTTLWRKLSFLFSSDLWAVLFLLMLALTLAGVLLFVLSPAVAWRRTGFYGGIVALLLGAFSLGAALSQRSAYVRQDSAVVMSTVLEVRSSPASGQGDCLFLLHEGTCVRVLDNVGEWCNIQIADGRQGWVKHAGIEVI